jgi:hypothetical protein
MLINKTKEPIFITWKDHVKISQELHNSQEQQDQGSEEEKYSPEKGRGLVDTQKGTDLQKDRCQELNQDAANPILSRRLWKQPTT